MRESELGLAFRKVALVLAINIQCTWRYWSSFLWAIRDPSHEKPRRTLPAQSSSSHLSHCVCPPVAHLQLRGYGSCFVTVAVPFKPTIRSQYAFWAGRLKTQSTRGQRRHWRRSSGSGTYALPHIFLFPHFHLTSFSRWRVYSLTDCFKVKTCHRPRSNDQSNSIPNEIQCLPGYLHPQTGFVPLALAW